MANIIAGCGITGLKLSQAAGNTGEFFCIGETVINPKRITSKSRIVVDSKVVGISAEHLNTHMWLSCCLRRVNVS